jgi:hypothetical protein
VAAFPASVIDEERQKSYSVVAPLVIHQVHHFVATTNSEIDSIRT